MSLTGIVRAAGLALGLAASATEAGPSDYQGAWLRGAWLLSGRGCGEVYSSTGRGTAFKTPLDIFAPAFVISGKQLRTPMASCRIRSIRPVGDRQRLDLACANGVAANDVTVLVATAPNGALRRYYSDQDPTGVDYQRCAK